VLNELKHYYTMKTYGGMDPQIHVFLTSALGGVFRPGRFNPWERAFCTNWIGDLAGPRTGMDNMDRRKILPIAGLKLRTFGRPPRR
jgi:hypothetical protein